MALAGAPGCSNEPSVEEGLMCFIHGPNASDYPDIDPFKGCPETVPLTNGSGSCQCDIVRICYVEEGETKPDDSNCQTVEYQFRATTPSLKNLPLGEDVSILVECYDQAIINGVPQQLGPTARGQSIPISHEEDEPVEECTVYMLPVGQFGPTYSPMLGTKTEAFEARWGAVAAPLGTGHVLLAGGSSFDDDCAQPWWDPKCIDQVTTSAEIYNPGNGAFQLLTSPAGTPVLMTERRAFAASVVLPTGEIAIFGGFTAPDTPTNTVEIFDPKAGTFRPEGGIPMGSTRARHTATLIYGGQTPYVLLAGGIGTGEGSWEIWSPTQMPVALTGPLAESRWNHTATLITKELDSSARNMVLLAGGEGMDEGKGKVRDTAEVVAIDSVGTPLMLEAPRYLCSNDGATPPAEKKTMHAAAFVPKRHFVYISGGFSDSEHLNPTGKICVWKTRTSSGEGWEDKATFSLKKARGAHTATALPLNVVLFAGGLCKEGGALEPCKTVEIVFEYMSPTGEIVVDIGPDEEFAIPMLWPRFDHGALVSSDAKVFFFGGLSGPVATPEAYRATEVFNPQ